MKTLRELELIEAGLEPLERSSQDDWEALHNLLNQ